MHALYDLLRAWVLAHPKLALLIGAYLLAHAVVALTPKRYQQKPWIGWMLWVAHRAVFATHWDQLGTIQLPILAKALVFGDDGLDTAMKAADKPAAKAPPAPPPAA